MQYFHRLVSIKLIFLILILLTSCHVGRYFSKNLADINDHRFFPTVGIKGNEKAASFPVSKTDIEKISLQFKGNELLLPEFLDQTRSTSFLILKNGKILFEWYEEGMDTATIHPSFSVSKSVVSTMVGIAIEDKKIGSVDDKIIAYLGAGYDESLKEVSFRNLLNMRAGLNFKERYSSPFSPMAKYYYGRQLDRYIKKLRVVEPAGRTYEYQSASTQLAGIALESAIGMDFEAYFAQKLWIPAGMGNTATWNLDRPGGEKKYFCCLNATTRDFAHFGYLFANDGRWGDAQIVPASWVREVFEGRNNSRDSQDYPYYLGWRQTPDHGIFAKGVLGQYIYVNPKEKLVIVRTGRSSKKLDWGETLMRITSLLRP